ncbi:uncharacterized protein RJT21DRAFT_123129, partial [Scheffersomyces amazonensis]|uniref:uncharacterized protein n=1 Tax=Scheffersomyces amazonensis TaxID=1078765 RepID=UPI00315C5523
MKSIKQEPIDDSSKISKISKQRQRQPISCNLCRTIKRKCDGKSPCSNCIRKSKQCIYPSVDKRRNRYSTEYIQTLEDGYKRYRDTLQDLVDNRGDLVTVASRLNELSDLIAVKTEAAASASASASASVVPPPPHPQPTSTGASLVSVYGPSSIYNESLSLTSSNTAATTTSSSPSSLNSPSTNSEPNPLHPQVLTSSRVQELIATSFKFLDMRFLSFIIYDSKSYEVYRRLCHIWHSEKSFDKFNSVLYSYPTNQFISPELIYGFCLFGATILNSVNEANYYYELSKKLCFCDSYSIGIPMANNSPASPVSSSSNDSLIGYKFSFEASSFPRIQSLVILAIHDLGKGNLTTSWQLTGLAFRMGSDVGFDNSFKVLDNEELGKLKNKLYWGCFIIDAFLGIIYGRNKMMTFQRDYPVFRNDVNNKNLARIVDVCVFCEQMFPVIYHSMPFLNFEDSKRNFLQKFDKVKQFNSQLLNWRRNLDPEYYWDMEIIHQAAQTGQKDFGLPLVFYVVILILNKPFLNITKNSDLSLITNCIDEFELILRQFKDFDSHQSVISIYTIILMANTLFAILNQFQSVDDRARLIGQIQYFIGALKKFDANTWIVVKTPIEVLSARMDRLISDERNRQHQPYDKRSPTTPIIENLVHPPPPAM